MTAAALEADLRVVHSESQVPPILRLPCETTSQIFQHCLPEDDFPRPSIKCAPLQLTHVCSTWRELAIGTPRLWSKILLCTGTPDPEGTNRSSPGSTESHVEALEAWMRRATPLLLSVQIHYPTLPQLPRPALTMEALPPVFRVMAKNTTRWKSVWLSLPQEYMGLAWITTQLGASNLESFDIDDTSIPKSRPKYPEYIVLLEADTAESLAALSVRASIVYDPTKATAFVRLRKLSLQHSRPTNCLHLLKYCPVLEDLNLSFYDLPHIAFLSENPTILVPRLRNFHLSHTGNSEHGESSILAHEAGEIGIFLDSLKLPVLRCFYLSMTIKGSARSADPNLPWNHLSQLITRSNCPLDRLELHSPHIDSASILECLQLCPDLKHLGIQADDELERKIAHVLPSLDSLQIFE